MIDSVIVSFLGTLWLLSALHQPCRGRWLGRIKRLDGPGLLPTWTFFAPNPGRSDVLMFVRDMRPDGSVSPWQELGIGRRTRWTLLRPQRRVTKAFTEIKRKLLRELDGERAPVSFETRPHLLTELSYLLLLTYASGARRDPTCSRRQLLIVTRDARRSRLRPLLISPFHALEALEPYSAGNLYDRA